MQPQTSGVMGALAGLFVIDATQMLAGPLAGLRLADLGADVVKLEGPAGEFNRTHGLANAQVDGEMTTFLALNRNKRSLVVDLKQPVAQQVVRDLAASADVFIQNFRHGTAEKLGVGAEQLLAINPRLVYCSISGYGSSGPYRDRPGQDLVIQGYSGSMWSAGKVGDPPLPSSLWAADAMTGYQAVIGILAAVEARHRTGRGQHVEVDMLSAVLDAQIQELVTYLNTGIGPTRTAEDGAHASIPAPYGTYETADGWIALAMCPLPSLGEALDDDWLRQLTDYNDGVTRRDEVYRRIRGAFRGRTTSEWLKLLDVHGVWAGPVYDYAQLVDDEHVRATGMFVEQPNTGGGTVRTLRPPLRLSETPAAVERGAPALGAHSAEVLMERLGVSREAVRQLIEAGAVIEAPPEEDQ